MIFLNILCDFFILKGNFINIKKNLFLITKNESSIFQETIESSSEKTIEPLLKKQLNHQMS